MKKVIYLCLISILVFNNIIISEAKTDNSSMSIQDIDETKETKKQINNTQKSATSAKTTTQTSHIPFTGWFQVQGTTQWVYFLRDIPLSGWQYITGGGWDGWYYFNTTNFIMLQNAYTPDGYFVGADGRWVQNYNNRSINNTRISNVIGPTNSADINNQNSTNNSNSIISGVKDVNSKYLYNRIEYGTNSKSITSSMTLDGETIKKNNIRLAKNGYIKLPDTGKYTMLTFNYIVEQPNENNEYDLQIYINGSLEDELDSFTQTKQGYVLEFEENSSIEFKWFVNTEDGSKSAKAVNLYIYNGILFK